MRVRFAPSPTGYLHIGNARTAVINDLLAKKLGGTLVLRIEDTDKERSTLESEESIMASLKWLGIEWHEGPDKEGNFGPYRQSERFEIYDKYTKKLLSEDKAYKCFCTRETTEALKKDAEKENRPYRDPCRNLLDDEIDSEEKAGKEFTVRFKVPENENIIINDHAKGTVTFNSDHIGGDFIIVRSDGSPVYNYIVIIDDALMNISHVIRGEDHLSNTPKQVLIAKALGLPIPEYTHLALVLGPDKKKLSKRHGITSVDLYKDEGYLPDALVNYLAMLGWATESGEEILSNDDLISQIDLDNLAKSAAIFDFQKLKWMNSIYIRNYDIQEITALFTPYLQKAGFNTEGIEGEKLAEVIDLIRGNCEILSEIDKVAGIFLNEIPEFDDEAKALLKDEEARKAFTAAYELLDSDLNETNFADQFIDKVKEKTSLKGKTLFHSARVILTGRVSGPDLKETIRILGFETCKARIINCYEKSKE